MNRRKVPLLQAHALHQKQLIQSILQFVPLQEAMLSAKVCKSWHNASKNGLKFHSKRLRLARRNEKWAIYLKRYVHLGDIPEPRRSHILEIIDEIHFFGSTWPEAIKNLEQAPPNLKALTFDEIVPTQHEFLELLVKINVANVEKVRFYDFYLSSTSVAHILNNLPSLKKAHLFGWDNMVDFKQVNTVETVMFHVKDEMPNLEGKVKVLELWDNYEIRMIGFNSDMIQGVEKIILEMADLGIIEEKLDLRCEEICFTLATAKETLKTFVIKTFIPELLPRVFEEPRYHDVDGWSCSLSNDEIVFKRIEK